jgi:hypothetical protein
MLILFLAAIAANRAAGLVPPAERQKVPVLRVRVFGAHDSEVISKAIFLTNP